MKVIIDMPKKDYDKMCKGELINTILVALKNGTPIPDNATNGDMIMTIFNCMVIEISNGKVYVEGIYFPFDEEWWNSLYKAESEV